MKYMLLCCHDEKKVEGAAGQGSDEFERRMILYREARHAGKYAV